MTTELTGTALRGLRTHWGLTLEQLGELLNVQKSTLSRWESGEMPAVGSKESTQIKALLLLDKRARHGDPEAIDAVRALRKETFSIETEWHPVLGETVLTNKIPRNFADAMAALMDVAEQAQPVLETLSLQAAKTVRKGAVLGLGSLKIAAEKLAEGAELLKARIETLENEAGKATSIPVEETEVKAETNGAKPVEVEVVAAGETNNG
jgi:transcriptional regulator with XRE-family HTH domain